MSTASKSFSRRAVLTALPIAGVFSLSACGANLPQPGQPVVATLGPDQLSSGVSDESLGRILKDVSSVLYKADTARDAKLLEARFTGPALAQRIALYTWWTAAPANQPSKAFNVITLPVAPPNIRIASGSQAKPRELVLAVASPSQTESSANFILLALRQATPRENYKVWAGVSIMVPQPDAKATILGAGAPFPAGNATVPMDSAKLVRTPKAVVEHYLDVLNNGAASGFAGEFFADAFQKKVALLRRQFVVGVKGTKDAPAGTLQSLESATVNFSSDFSNYSGLLTEDGNAVVLAQISLTITLVNANPESKLNVFLPKYRALAGTDAWQNRLVIENTLVAAFTIPSKGSTDTKVRCIGVDADLGEGLGQSTISYADASTGGASVTTLIQSKTDGPGDGWGAVKVTAT